MKNISLNSSSGRHKMPAWLFRPFLGIISLLSRKPVFSIFIALLFTPAVNAEGKDVPYVPTPHNVVEKMLDVAGIGPGDYVIDLGSGDGRIVINAVKRGAAGHGVEIDPKRIRQADEKANEEDLSDKVMFVKEDVFETEISEASVITMYLLHSVNVKLRPRLLEDLKPGTKVVSHDFDMGDWRPDKHFMVDGHNIYYWIIPAKVKGEWRWQAEGETFSMTAQQEFQEVQLDVRSGEDTLKVKKQVLTGDRFHFTADNPNNERHYVFHGFIEEGKAIEGTMQIFGKDDKTIEGWSATPK